MQISTPSTAALAGRRYSDSGQRQVIDRAADELWEASKLAAETGRRGVLEGYDGYAGSAVEEPVAPTRRNLALVERARDLAEHAVDLLRRLRADDPAPDSYTNRILEIQQATSGIRALDAIVRRGPNLTNAERGEFIETAAEEFYSVYDQLKEVTGNWG